MDVGNSWSICEFIHISNKRKYIQALFFLFEYHGKEILHLVYTDLIIFSCVIIIENLVVIHTITIDEAMYRWFDDFISLSLKHLEKKMKRIQNLLDSYRSCFKF